MYQSLLATTSQAQGKVGLIERMYQSLPADLSQASLLINSRRIATQVAAAHDARFSFQIVEVTSFVPRLYHNLRQVVRTFISYSIPLKVLITEKKTKNLLKTIKSYKHNLNLNAS